MDSGYGLSFPFGSGPNPRKESPDTDNRGSDEDGCRPVPGSRSMVLNTSSLLRCGTGAPRGSDRHLRPDLPSPEYA